MKGVKSLIMSFTCIYISYICGSMFLTDTNSKTMCPRNSTKIDKKIIQEIIIIQLKHVPQILPHKKKKQLSFEN
jgi:hypothetical protein